MKEIIRSLLVFCTLLFMVVVVGSNPNKISADTIGDCSACSGTFTCEYYTTCRWTNSGALGCSGTCNYGERNTDCGSCTASCDSPTQTTRSCTTQGTSCYIDNGGCTAGNDAATSCNFNSNCGSESSCGDGSCNNGETSASCPSDCPASGCGAGYQYCGGCIDSCRPTSKSCTQWINEECNATPPGCVDGGSQCWCTTIQECGAFPGPTQWVSDNGWCDAPEQATGNDYRCCCTDCLLGTFREYAGSCGSNLGQICGACQVAYVTRATSNPGVFCGGGCVNDSSCSTSSCTPRCGQDNGCGGTCPTTDTGIPAGVSFTNVTPGGQLVISEVSPGVFEGVVRWSTSTKADYYQYQFFPQGTSSCSQTGQGAACGNVNNPRYRFNPVNGVTYYTIRVRPVNNTCGVQSGIWSQISFYIVGDITGTFHLDQNGTASLSGGVCTGTSNPISPGSGAAIGANGLNGSVSGTFPTSTTYRIRAPFWAPNGNNQVILTPGTDGSGAQYQCTCPAGCTLSGIDSPQANVNFYLTPIDLSNGGWWQTQGGNVYAGSTSGVAVRSYIPVDTCDAAAPACTSLLITEDAADYEDSAGVLVTGGGTADFTDAAGNQTGYVTERTAQLFAAGSTVDRVKEGYDYFYRLYSLGLSPSEDFASNYNNATKPSTPPNGGKAAYFRDGDLTIRNPWSVAAGETIVVFVDGNLTITDASDALNVLNVDEGGFLAFIVSGNVTIAGNVGNQANLTSTAANIEGVFVADGTFNLPSVGAGAGGDERFIGEGIFVGWGGFNLARDFTDGGSRRAENNDKPVMLFRYRPDLVENTPEEMKTPRFIWQETN